MIKTHSLYRLEEREGGIISIMRMRRRRRRTRSDQSTLKYSDKKIASMKGRMVNLI